MFHGGTNWGFMNGANVLDRLPFYAPDVTSYGKQLYDNADITYISGLRNCDFPSSEGALNLYLWYFADYDAPITESGDYTEKYYSTATKILEYDPISSLVAHPDPPEIVPPIKYGDVKITEQMDYEDILSNVVSEQLINEYIHLPSCKFLSILLKCCLIAILFPTSAYWTSGIVRKS